MSLERRVEILEWQVKMLLQKIGVVAGSHEATQEIQKLLETMPEELKDK